MRKLLFIHTAALRRATLVFIALALAACSMGSQSEIERNQQKWQDSGISHYRFNLFVGCFCVFSQDMPLAIEVQDGVIVSLEYKDGRVVDDINAELFERYATIDRIFSELETDMNGAADEVVVTYDPTYGFPTQANIDFVKDAIDDELALTISNFEELP